MRILILGDNYTSKKFFEKFSENSENIVFSTNPELKNFIEFDNISDVCEFCEANDINLVLFSDKEYLNLALVELLSSKNLSACFPLVENPEIFNSKIAAKKFMYKNNIETPPFQLIQTSKSGVEYLKQASCPQVLKPEIANDKEHVFICRTLRDFKKNVNDLFASGNKKILLEDYIEGKSFTIWTLTEGYSIRILGACATYKNNLSLFEPSFVDDFIKEKAYNEIIMPTIESMSEQNEEYIGILGFDCILDKNNEICLINYRAFFDDLEADFFLSGFDMNWAEVFNSTIVGDVFLKYNFEPDYKYMLTLRQDEKIIFLQAKTKSNFKMYLNELNYDLKEFYEAEKLWKY